MNFEENFSPEPNSGCWLWLRACTTAGYGEIFFKGRMEYAHRVSAHLYKDFDLDSDLHVLHRCDVKCCVNPDHLFIGTNRDNVIDRNNKGGRTNQNSGKEYCIHGHSLIGDNCYTIKGRRQCRACKRDADKRQKLKRKLSTLGEAKVSPDF